MEEELKRCFLCVIGLYCESCVVTGAGAADICQNKVKSGTYGSITNQNLEDYGLDCDVSYTQSTGTNINGRAIAVCTSDAGTTAGALKDQLTYEYGNANKYCWKKIIYPFHAPSWIYFGNYSSSKDCLKKCGSQTLQISANTMNSLISGAINMF